MFKKSYRLIATILMIFLISFISSCSISSQDNDKQLSNKEQIQNNEINKRDILTVHIIDVGQADCILIKSPSGKNMLIDAGNNEDEENIKKYLKNQKVSKIDYLIGTHPHEDHIGSIDGVIKSFDILNFYMPKVSTTTKTFKDVLEAAKTKQLTINTAKYGVKFDMGDGVFANMLAPIEKSYDDLNNYSAVIKLTFGKISFLFTGDAGNESEQQMLSLKEDLKADVLKVGHHGSSTSTSEQFLDAVSPKYAVISVGAQNDYNHPSKSTLDKLNKRGIKIFRTDKDGTIVFSTDGEDVKIEKEK